MASDIPIRRPKSAYIKTNGFVDPIKMQVQGQSSTARDAESGMSDRDHDHAVQKRHFVEHVLETKGRYFPECVYCPFSEPLCG